MTDGDGIARYKDFSSLGEEEIRFTLAPGYDFVSVDDLTPRDIKKAQKSISKAVDMTSEDTSDDEYDTKYNEYIVGAFSPFLDTEGQAHLLEGLEAKKIRMGIKRIQKVFYWLLEEHGLRPTEQSSAS